MLKSLTMTGVALLATLTVTNNAIANVHHRHAVNKNTVPVKEQANLCNFSGKIGVFYAVGFSTTVSGNAKVVSFPPYIEVGHGGNYTVALPCTSSTKNDKIAVTAKFFMGTKGNKTCTFTFTTANNSLVVATTDPMYCSVSGSFLGIGFQN